MARGLIVLLAFFFGWLTAAGAVTPAQFPEGVSPIVLVADTMTTLTLTNASKAPIDVIAVDPGGAQRLRVVLKPGERTSRIR